MDKLAAGGRGKSSINYDNSQNDGNPTRAALDELLQTEAKLNEAVESKHEQKRQWHQRESALWWSNWKLGLVRTKLQLEADGLDKEVLAKMSEFQKAHDELETYKSRNKQEAADFWNHFQEETQRYSSLFTNAHIEYSSACLNQDIQEYRRQSDIVLEKIQRVEKEMESARVRYGLVELGTNENAKLLADLDIVKNTLIDKGNLPLATQAAEETINVLKLKVKQKQHDIEYLKNRLSKK